MNVLTPEMIRRVAALCHQFDVERLELFGSACTSAFDSKCSDLDLLVQFQPDADLGPWMTCLFELQNALAGVCGRTVDVVMTAALKNPYFRREANKTRTVVYDASQVPEMAQ